MTEPRPAPRTGTLRRTLAEARPHAGRLVLLLALHLLATPLALLLPLPVQIAVDSVFGGRAPPGILADLLPRDPHALLAACAGMVVAVAALLQAQGLVAWMLETSLGERLVLEFRARLFRHLQRLSLSFHDRTGSSDAVYRILYDAPSVRYVAVEGVLPFVAAVVQVVATVAVTAWIDPGLALVAVAVCPVLYVLTEVYRRRLRRRWTHAKERESEALAVVQESVAQVRVVKAFGQEERQGQRYEEGARASVAANLRAVFAQGGFGALVGLTTAVGTAAVLWVGGRHVLAGSLTVGQLLLVLGYLARIYEPLRQIGSSFADVQKSLVGAERAFALLDEPNEAVERPGALSLVRARGECVRGVSFRYAQGGPVLRDVSFDVPAGSRVGIAGRTGSGKTTLVGLLPRFYDPEAGSVLLDGVDSRDYRLADLLNQFSIVLQEPVLFSTTIRENIAYGKPSATEAEIVAAAKAAGAHDFASAQPQGYDTEVGERGQRLSGGERQRIALARAFLKDAPILLLDEPTSSIDVATEAQVLEALERLMRGRTTFLIAHRLHTLAGCDVRLEVEAGRVTLRTGDLTGIAIDDGPSGAPSS